MYQSEIMKARLQVIVSSLKEVLQLYDTNAPITEMVLGDTCHPESGYITESITIGIKNVFALLTFDYDFPCLVDFSATIGSTNVKLDSDSNEKLKYIIEGPAIEIRRLLNRILEEKANGSDSYKYEVNW